MIFFFLPASLPTFGAHSQMPKFHEDIFVFGSGRFPGEFLEILCITIFVFGSCFHCGCPRGVAAEWCPARLILTNVRFRSTKPNIFKYVWRSEVIHHIWTATMLDAPPHFFFVGISLFEIFKFMRQLSHRIKNRQIQMCIVFYLFGRKWKEMREKWDTSMDDGIALCWMVELRTHTENIIHLIDFHRIWFEIGILNIVEFEYNNNVEDVGCRGCWVFGLSTNARIAWKHRARQSIDRSFAYHETRTKCVWMLDVEGPWCGIGIAPSSCIQSHHLFIHYYRCGGEKFIHSHNRVLCVVFVQLKLIYSLANLLFRVVSAFFGCIRSSSVRRRSQFSNQTQLLIINRVQCTASQSVAQ